MEININEKDKQMCEDTYLLGVLAIDEKRDEVVGIIPNSDNEDVEFYVKPVTRENQYIINDINTISITKSKDFFIGIDRYQHNLNAIYIDKEYFLKNNNDKIKYILNLLKDKLILFKPKITKKEYGIIKNIEIISLEKKSPYSSGGYITTPKVNISNDIFEKELLSKKDIILSDYNHQMLPPEYIICGQYIYFNFESW